MIKFKRLLTVGLMALLCAGTATAASQLNSVQVTPSASAATVNLHTTGSYAHKEYRPDEHLMLVDLTGVTAASAVDHTATVNSAALKGYKLSTYTSASGNEVTRIELALGDGVSVSVNDVNDGLKIQLSSGVSSALTPSSPSASVSTPLASPVSSSDVKSDVKSSVKSDVKVVAKNTPLPAVSVTAPATLAHPAQPSASGSAPPLATIRNVSVHTGQGTLDITVEGSNSAHSFLLKNPDRLVLDFSNAVLQPSVKSITVHTKDVLQVRVGRFQSEPPVVRIVVDLSGPRTFDVVPSDKQLIVRVKNGDAGIASAPLKAAPSPVLASSVAPEVVGHTSPVSSQSAHAIGPADSKAADTKATVTGSTTTAPVVEPASQNPSASKQSTSTTVASKPAHAADSPLPDPQTSASKASAVEPVVTGPKAPAAVATAIASAPVIAQPPVELAVAEPPAIGPKVIGPLAPESKVPPTAATAADSTAPKTVQPSAESARLAPPAPEPSTATPAQSLTSSPKYTGEPISVNLKDVDLKDFFRLIHEISGLNIVLDPSVKGTVTLVLDDVPWDQASGHCFEEQFAGSRTAGKRASHRGYRYLAQRGSRSSRPVRGDCSRR